MKLIKMSLTWSLFENQKAQIFFRRGCAANRSNRCEFFNLSILEFLWIKKLLTLWNYGKVRVFAVKDISDKS